MNLDWVGGFMDGEGSFSLLQATSKRKLYYVPVVQVSQTNRELLEEVVRTVGIDTRVYTYEQKGWGKKPLSMFRVSAKKAADFMRIIHPHLVLKRRQVELILGHYDKYLGVHRSDELTEEAQRTLKLLEETRSNVYTIPI